jgi:DNA topoisomerase-1
MVIKWGRHGSLIACTGYPECTNTRELTVDLPDIDKADLTEQDEKNVLRQLRSRDGSEERPLRTVPGLFGLSGLQDHQATRRSAEAEGCSARRKVSQLRQPDGKEVRALRRFVACSNYPKCKFVKQKTIGVKCPNCNEGEVVERRSKRGKTFYGCNRYPDCDFVAWGKPIPEKCPDCGGRLPDREVPEGGPSGAVSQQRVQIQEALEIAPEPPAEEPVEVKA